MTEDFNIVHADGTDPDYIALCNKLNTFQENNVAGFKEHGLQVNYDLHKHKDVFIVYDGNKPIGCSCLWYHSDEVCEMIRIFVEEDYRGRHLVQLAVNKVEELAKEKGYSEVHLRTWACTPSAPIAYDKLGYRPVSENSFPYPDKFPNALLLSSNRIYMMKDL